MAVTTSRRHLMLILACFATILGLAIQPAAAVPASVRSEAELTTQQAPTWQQLDNNRATVDIVAAGNTLYQRHGNGDIWRLTSR